MRRSAWLALPLVLCGCDTFREVQPAPAPQRSERAPEDRDAASAIVLMGTFQEMQRLAQSEPAEQAEILAAARAAYERSPQGSAQLRYALLLASPAYTARDATMAQTLLRELAAQPETLVPAERAVALVELAQIDRELGLANDNSRLQSEAMRTDRDRIAAAQRRLQVEMDENTKLRKQLEDAQTKLDAIANIERNVAERKARTQGPQP